MRYKTEHGIELDLTERDIRDITAMSKKNGVKNNVFDDMEEYFKHLHKKSVEHMEKISEHVITDEDSIDIAVEYVAKNGTYNDFIKMLRYEMDYNLAYHILESAK